MKSNLLLRGKRREKKRGHPRFITLLILMFFAVSVSDTVYAQTQQRISLDMKQATREEVILHIREVTRYKFAYRVNDLPTDRQDYAFSNAGIEQVMNRLMTGTRLRWSDNEGTILISQAPSQQREASAARTLTGRVTDDQGQPVIGASVLVKNTFVGVSTDANGNFSINVPAMENPVLAISFIGKRTKEVAVQRGVTVYDTQLESDVANIDAVVVTGIVDRSKSSFTGSATMVTGDQLASVGTKNIFQGLAAFVPGLQMPENIEIGADPNTVPEILIRGRGSFMEGSTIPTFVVDGAEVNVQYIFDMDINDIESVTVLKDASATALWGSKASNGVIVITTKPMLSGRLKLNYSGTYRLVTPDLSDYDLLDAGQKLEFEKRAGLYTASQASASQYELDEKYNEKFQRIRSGVDTDWLSKPLRNTVATNHNVTLYGGEGDLRYNIVLRYGNDRGVMKDSDRKRYGISYKFIYNLGTKLFFSNNTDIQIVKESNVPYGSFADFVNQNPYDLPYDESGKLSPTLSDNRLNPLYEASLNSHDIAENLTITNNFNIRYHIIDDLRMEGSFVFTKSKNDTEKYISPSSSSFTSLPATERGSIEIGNTKGMDYQGKLTLAYNKLLADQTLINIAGGANISEYNTDANGYKGVGIFSDKLAHPSYAAGYPASGNPSGSKNIQRSLGFFITGNFMYRDRYFFDFSYRGEGSSVFGDDNRFGNFWSVGAGWNIHNEAFLNMKPSDRLKLRVSAGYTGNANFSPYQAMTTYEYRSNLFYGKGIGAVPITIGNPDLAYEKAFSINAGFDLVLFNNRWNLTLDYYHKTTDNLLLSNTKAPSIGVSMATENVGKLRNIGIELATRATIIQNRDWNWSVGLLASHNRNKILKISDALKEQNALNNDVKEGDYTLRKPIPLYEEGESISALKVVRSAGIDPLTGAEVYIDRNGNPTFVYNYLDKYVAGDTDPDIYGSLSSFLTWKGFQLNLIFAYRTGAQLYNSTLVTRIEGANPFNNADKRVLTERWKEPGDYAKYRDIADSTTPYQTDRFVQNEHLFNLQTLSIAYDFPQSFSQKLGMSRLRAQFLSNDTFRLSSIKQERGLTYPYTRTYELSLQVTF